jgi:hypothetical protein
MKKYVCVIFACLFLNIVFSQNLKFAWLNQISSSGTNINLIDLCLDNKKNIISGGQIEGNGKFYTKTATISYTTIGGTDCIVQKVNSFGDIVWLKTFGSAFFETVTGVANDIQQNVVSVGTYQKEIFIDPDNPNFKLQGLGYYNGFVQKLDSTGKFIWGKNIIATYSINPSSVTTDTNKNIYVSGNFKGTIILEGLVDSIKAESQGQSIDGFLLKLDPTGKCLWIRTFGNNNTIDCRTTHVEIYNDTLICIGQFQKEVNFGSVSTPYQINCNSGQNLYVCKYTTDNSLVFAKSIGENAIVSPTAFHVDTTGHIYISGYFSGSGDFDPNFTEKILTNTSDNFYMFLLQLSSKGICNFAGLLSTENSQGYVSTCQAIATDSENNIYLGGRFVGYTDFDPDPDSSSVYQSQGISDMFLAKYSQDFNFLWLNQFANNSNLDIDNINDLIVDPKKDVFSTGVFTGILDFAPADSILNIQAKSSYTSFTLKWQQCAPVTINDTIKICKLSSYTKPDGIVISNIVSDTAYTYLKSSFDTCDSTFNILLKVVETNAEILISSDSILAINSGDKYQWLDCDNNFESIPGAEENYLIPKKTGNYALEIENNGCKDTSDCISFVLTALLAPKVKNNLKIYPNPTNDKIFIEQNSKIGNYTIQVIDQTGRKLISKTGFAENSIQLDLSSLESGMYYLLLKQEELVRVLKIVKD